MSNCAQLECINNFEAAHLLLIHHFIIIIQLVINITYLILAFCSAVVICLIVAIRHTHFLDFVA